MCIYYYTHLLKVLSEENCWFDISQLVALPELFEYTTGQEVDVQGRKAGIEEKKLDDRDHVKHLVKWILKKKRMYLMRFGYNFTD